MLSFRFSVFQIVACLAVVGFAMSSTAEAQRGRSGGGEDEISFTKDVAPIISAKCGKCHVSASRGRYGIKSYEALMKSDSVEARKPDDSYFIEVIENGEMPKGGLKVSDSELKTLRQWISEGAKFDGDDKSQMISASAGGARGGAGGSTRGSRSQSSRGTRGEQSGSRSQGRRPSRSRSTRGSQSNAIESNKLLAFFDLDGDGKLSLKEIDAASRMLRSLDENNDKRITGDELEEFGDR